ncbi:hypothetical protein [Streptantibioticus ferralitis]|uniref:Uncharacterized protein n=1 Tax=Streptantibioticus ferralitis TaxID=236510 RepID=A0ABT5Z3F9_9ACTN|nr:hypothetical protein [Streptantibioticus ferralitis]MDF2258364.1 hypothetical protein [Streptantibioticus ferralitis]
MPDLTPGDVLDCGHPPTPKGIGTGRAIYRGRSMCYACADEQQREDIKKADAFAAYVTPDHVALTTWSGGELAKITSYKVRDHIAPGGRPYRMQYVWATTPDGTRWHGRGTTAHDLIAMHREGSR